MSPKNDSDLAPEAPPTEAELASAASLRNALERGRPDGPGDADWEMLEAIRAAADPSPLSEERQRRILEEALANKPRGKVIYFAFGGVATMAAMAAVLALVVKSPAMHPEVASAASPAMALSRSTAELFPDGIPAKGGTSDRVDRIAYARARDLRENRFSRWGVR
jgi:hypothetical protein